MDPETRIVTSITDPNNFLTADEEPYSKSDRSNRVHEYSFGTLFIHTHFHTTNTTRRARTQPPHHTTRNHPTPYATTPHHTQPSTHTQPPHTTRNHPHDHTRPHTHTNLSHSHSPLTFTPLSHSHPPLALTLTLTSHTCTYYHYASPSLATRLTTTIDHIFEPTATTQDVYNK
jgi:hypothetical protein